ncbi:MAG: cytochrome c6 [Cyanobacteriota bacterium]|jgi:cytochrome c6
MNLQKISGRLAISRLYSSVIFRLGVSLIALIFLNTFLCLPVLAESIPNLDHGAKIFEANCAGCHINGGNIVRRGKNLKSKALHKNKVDTQEAIASLVTNGKGIMSAYGDKLSQQEITDVSAYVLQQAAQDWKK